MNLARPYETVSPTLHGAVLVALYEAAGPLSGREVARRVGHSQEGVRRVLLALEEHGLVTASEATPARLFALNRAHVLGAAVETMARARSELCSRIEEEVKGWRPRPLNVTVFGSVARGEGDERSDIDVLVVRADDVPAGFSHWDEHLPMLDEAVRRWTGNVPQILEYGHAEVLDRVRKGSSLTRSILEEGWTVYGRPLRELARGVRLTA